jgi:hypothetical protein
MLRTRSGRPGLVGLWASALDLLPVTRGEPVVTIIITTVSLRAGVPMVTRDIMVHMAAMHMDTMVGRQPGDLVDMRRRQGMYTITGAQQQQ